LKRILLLFTVALLAMILAPSLAWTQTLPDQPGRLAEPGREAPGQPVHASCFGEVSSEAARSPVSPESGLGLHASNPNPFNDDPHDTPRQGVGNVAMEGDPVADESVSSHGTFVAGIDRDPTTQCP
jgi:hypothetical protein